MTGRVPILIFALAAALWAGLGPLPQPVLAQGVQRIVAIVNDEVISGYDVEQRMRLILSTTQIQRTPEQMRRLQSQITEGLIDEAIQLQEAARLNIRIADEEIEQAVRYIEDQNGLAEGALALVLQGVNTDIETLYSQIRAQIAWSKVVSRRLRPTVFVGQDEIDAVLERMEAAEGLTEYLISEIFLSVDVPGRRTEIARDAANVVAEARRGTPFDALARQMSQGISAPVGGHVGWVRSGELARELDSALAVMEIGLVSDPIETIDGFYILQLRDRKQALKLSESEITVELKQIFLPLPEDASAAETESQTDLASTVVAGMTGCTDFDNVIQEMGSTDSGDLGMVNLGDMPANFRSTVAALAIGEASAPVRTAQGIHVFMVCDRIVPEIDVPDRRSIENNIGQTRLSMLARRYLRDLRRDAVIELR